MKEEIARPDVEAVLSKLKDFQRETVEYGFRRLYTDADLTHRFLVADEVGLGKTLVARGIVAKAIDHLWDSVEKIDVIYICSNADIARQNLRRLAVTDTHFALASRMTLLPTLFDQIQRRKLNLISFTPSTSFQLKQAAGWAEERVLLYWLLHEAWGVRGKAMCNLLQGRVSNAEKFRSRVRDYAREQIDRPLTEKFRAALNDHIERDRAAGRPDLRTRFESLCSDFAYKRDVSRIPHEQRHEQNRFIGDLRAVLAGTCIRALEPDLVILDEFQRFKDLLCGDDDASLLARELFDYEGDDGKARVLLLSATPYRMYTIAGDADADADHYKDFLQTLRFLQNDVAATARVGATLQDYRRAMMRLAADGPTRVIELKAKLEHQLRRVMVRTERLAASDDRNGMLTEVAVKGVQLEARDLSSYRSLQGIARHVEHHDTLEYWKSAPYLLSFMPDYKLKKDVVEQIEGPEAEAMAALLANDASLLLPRAVLAGRAAVDPPHPRLRWLLNDTIKRGLWKLLWLPPSLPYYQAGGPFAEPELERATKRLIFSAWRVVPRVISALLSREAERRMLGDNLTWRRTLDQTRERMPLLLRFARSEGRLTGMPVLGLLYPSITLARLGNPALLPAGSAVGKPLPTLDEVIGSVKSVIERTLAELPQGRPGGPPDTSWYWAAPVLLDLVHEPDVARRWLRRPDLASLWAGTAGGTESDTQEHDTLWTQHVTQLLAYVDGDEALGPRPPDLAEVLTLTAIAGPATTALRALTRLGGASSLRNDTVRDSAANVAWSVRNLFNLPEVTALLRTMNGDEPYWLRTLEYSAHGNLQAVLDEYAHVLPESLGHLEKSRPKLLRAVAEEMRRAIGVRAAQVGVDDFEQRDGEVMRVSERIRSRFAARFGEQEEDESRGERRADSSDAQTRTAQLRSAFNSPFWPFVLATTAVGQEGLDFHQYCHAVVHWNLPSNPVDLEQREGRVHRYKGHAVRRNVARQFGADALAAGSVDVWGWMFDQARATRAVGVSDIVPFWVYPIEGGARIERHVPALPLSQDVERLAALRRTLVVYRMVFGQPRQDELLEYLIAEMPADDARALLALLRIDLSPAATTPVHAPDSARPPAGEPLLAAT
jgi:hypothetical protein